MTIVYNSIPYGLLTSTSPSNKLTRKSNGYYSFGAHNLYLNSAAPANQAITVVSGATYSVTITGTVSVTASGAATGTWTAGTNTFTAATATLTLGSTSGAGTVHVRRTPSDSLYLETAGAARYALPFQWAVGGASFNLVRENAATNLVFPSLLTSGGTNLTWTANTNDVTDIFGTNTASKMVVTSTAATNLVFSATVAATAATVSCIVKKGSGATDLNIFALRNATTATILVGIKVNYDTLAITYTTGSSGASIVELGGGWLRIILTASSGITSGDSIQQYIGAAGGSETAGETLYFMHRQVEAGTYASSPILTYGATSTRAADTITEDIASFMSGATEYGMYVEAETRSALTTSPSPAWLSNTGATNRAGIFYNSTLLVKLFAYDDAVTYADLTSTVTTALNTNFRAAGSWKADDFRISVNGTAVQSDTSGVLPSPIDLLSLGFAGDFNLKKLAIYKRALTNAELLSLSTNGVLS